MAEETNVVRGINWRETFPFTHVFRSFRVAIHPSKLILALLAILILYTGGRMLDGMWSARSRGVPGEIEAYESLREKRLMLPPAVYPGAEGMLKTEIGGGDSFSAYREKLRTAIEASYAKNLVDNKIEDAEGKPISADEAKVAARTGKYLHSSVKEHIVAARDRKAEQYREQHKFESEAAEHGDYPEVKSAMSDYISAVNAAERRGDSARADARKLTDATARDAAIKKAKDVEEAAKADAVKKRDTALKAAREKYDNRAKNFKDDEKDRDKERRLADVQKEHDAYLTNMRDTYTAAETQWRDTRVIEGRGLWDLFIDYQIGRVDDVVAGAINNNWLGGLPNSTESAPGVFISASRFFTVAPRWAMGQHKVYFSLFGILFLIVWAIFGGAIARIAAVHVAREEKLSIRHALRFSCGKFLSFVFAPVIPLVIILFVGLVVAFGGLLVNLPFVGPILVGLFFFLALAAGFVMTLVALGTAGGLNLMYPTIAVEGSDSFDAISRSFSYIYARPWRMIWYTMVAIVYGAFTFLFVRVFIWMTLAFTHRAVGAWVWRNTDSTYNSWSSIWPGSGMWHLPYDINFLSLSAGDSIGAVLVAFWVFLTISLLGAYLISYYFSSSTIIYYLMRREVDATELDDVYVEQSEDDFAEPVAGPAASDVAPPGTVSLPTMTATTTTTTTSTPAAPAPSVVDATQVPPTDGAAPAVG